MTMFSVLLYLISPALAFTLYTIKQRSHTFVEGSVEGTNLEADSQILPTNGGRTTL